MAIFQFSGLTSAGNQAVTYGLKFLSVKALAVIHSGIKLYENCYWLYSGLTHEALQSYKQQTAALKSNIRENNLTAEKRKQIIKQIQTHIRNFNTLDWYEKTSLTLQGDTIWKNFFKALCLCKETVCSCENQQKKLKLQALYNDWRQHGVFAHYTPQALLGAVNMLEELAKLIEAATQEFHKKQHKISNVEHRKKYQAQLIAFSAQIQQQRKILIKAMHVRCVALLNGGNVNQVDALLDLINSLKALGVLNKRYKVYPRLSNAYANEAIAEFFYYIKVNKEKYAGIIPYDFYSLFALQQFNNKCKNRLVSVKQDRCVFFAPEAFVKAIPLYLRKPAWLFRGHNIRYKIFQGKSNLLLKLASLEKMQMGAINKAGPFGTHFWQELVLINVQLNQEKQLAQLYKANGWLALLRQKTNQFLTKWELQIEEQQKIITQLQIDFIVELANSAQPLEHLFEQPVFGPCLIDKTQQIMAELDAKIALYRMPDTESGRLYAAKQRLTSLFMRETALQAEQIAFDAIKLILDKAQKEGIIDCEAFDKLWEYLYKINCKAPTDVNREKFIAASESLCIKLQKEFYQFLEEQPAKAEHLKQVEKVMGFTQCAKLLCRFAALKQDLADQLANALLNFLQRYETYLAQAEWSATDNQIDSEVLNVLESIIAEAVASIEIKTFKLLREKLFALKREHEAHLKKDKASAAIKSMPDTPAYLKNRMQACGKSLQEVAMIYHDKNYNNASWLQSAVVMRQQGLLAKANRKPIEMQHLKQWLHDFNAKSDQLCRTSVQELRRAYSAGPTTTYSIKSSISIN